MGDLTKNFSKREFACNCGCGKDDIKAPVPQGCQEIRNEAGIPIRVDSGVRCEKRNKAVGGVANSYHVQGYAADLSCSKGGLWLFLLIVNMVDKGKFKQKPSYVIWYQKKNFVHVDWGKERTCRFAVK